MISSIFRVAFNDVRLIFSLAVMVLICCICKRDVASVARILAFSLEKLLD